MQSEWVEQGGASVYLGYETAHREHVVSMKQREQSVIWRKGGENQ